MAVAKKIPPVKKISKKPRAKKAGTSVPVRGSDPLFSIEFTPPKKIAAKKRTQHTAKVEDARPRLRSFVPIIFVSIDDHKVAKTSKYAGLVCICIGACFSAYALGGIYVDTMSLSLSNTHTTTHLHAAVASNPLFSLDAHEEVNASTTSAISTTTSRQTASSSPSRDTTLDSVMQPPLVLTLKNPLHLSGIVSISASVDHAEALSLYARKEGSLTDVYITSLQHLQDVSWSAVFNTASLPNGKYTLFVRVNNQYGFYTSRSSAVTIENTKVAAASSTPLVLQNNEDLHTKIDAVLNEFRTTDPHHDLRAELLSYATTTETEVHGTSTRASSTQSVNKRQLSFIDDIDSTFKHLLEMYAIVLRAKDPTGSDRMLAHITEFKRQTLDRLSTDLVPQEKNNSDAMQNLRDRIGTIITSETVRTKKQEDLIAARVGSQVSVDTDHDGIVDFDELTLYHTDPLNADSDADGYSDGAEVLAGYDPNKADGSVLRVVEDPRVSGISRPSILEITGGTVLHATTSGAVPEKILLTGRGLANSFVTISIFSTPITAITKTDANGLWSYVLDASLDDGQHQAYVTLEDNTGLIVAKSMPFFFIKEAGVYTLGTLSQKTLSSIDTPTEPLSQSAYMLIASFVVISIGLLLLLMSVFITHHRHLRTTQSSLKTKVAPL